MPPVRAGLAAWPRAMARSANNETERAMLSRSSVTPTAVKRRTNQEARQMDQHFAYAIDRRYLPVLVPFGLRPAKDGVTLTDGSFLATFGFFRLTTPLTNITGAHITRNYRWWTAFGVRGSRVDDGLSFGTNHDAGVCIHFAAKVPSPIRRSGHSALTVTVADLEGLARALGSDPAANSTRPPT